MKQTEAEQFLQIYQLYRQEQQLSFYTRHQREFGRAQKQALTSSIVLIFLAALASALESASISWLSLPCLITAAVCPVLASALTGYNALYAFEQQAKLYRDAMFNLQKVRVKMPRPQPNAENPDFPQELTQYVQDVENILAVEQGQWGQLAKNMKPQEI